MRDHRFWIVQVLAIGISFTDTTLDAVRVLHLNPDLYLLPESTYFVPVLYAALNFGVEGALPTGLWCVALTVPNIVLFHRGDARVGVAIQLALLVMLGVVVAHRVDTERRAKLAAEAANRQLADIQRSLQSYIGMALRAQEEERYRLSRELHDETIQDLAVVKAALEELRTDVDQHSWLEFIDAALQNSIDGIRRFCRALRPSVLDDLGLVAALELLVSELGGRTDVQAFLNVDGGRRRLDPELELVIFRIAQEALHNVERHASATNVTVSLEYRRAGVCLRIEDDGHGFDPTRVREGRLGLSGMQERAKLIGAVLRVTSEPGKTCVVVESCPEEIHDRYPAVALPAQLRRS
jgi:two-component system, NarL family, sensor histidine kinase DegS